MQFKARFSEIKKYTLCLGNISVNFSHYKMQKKKKKRKKKTGSNWCVYNFPVDYRAFDTSQIIDIHKYLTKKVDIK